jgi:hypothetical protein
MVVVVRCEAGLCGAKHCPVGRSGSALRAYGAMPRDVPRLNPDDAGSQGSHHVAGQQDIADCCSAALSTQDAGTANIAVMAPSDSELLQWDNSGIFLSQLVTAARSQHNNNSQQGLHCVMRTVRKLHSA